MQKKIRNECWGIDSEGLGCGLATESDIHSIQVCSSEGEYTGHAFRTPSEFQEWINGLRGDRRPKILYAFTLPFEYGSLAAWELLNVENSKGRYPWPNWADEPVNLFYIQPGRKRIPVYDVRSLFGQLTHDKKPLSNLNRLGDYLSEYFNEDVRKLSSPLPREEFGKRAPTSTEWPEFERYGIRDAFICAKAGEWLQRNVISGWLNDAIPIEQIYSWGTVAKYRLGLPKVGYVKYRDRKGGLVVGYENEWYYRILNSIFAGRSEAFWTGNVGRVYYNDVASLYPVSLIHSQAMLIRDVEEWTGDRTGLLGRLTWQRFQEATGRPYGWILGDFRTDDDLWGLPIGREDNNWYVTGDNLNGYLYHTLDVEAANAEVTDVRFVLVPVFARDRNNLSEFKFIEPMRLYEELAAVKLEGRYEDEIDKYCVKNTLNSGTGILGQAKPNIGITTNPPAYHTLLAESHLLMSQIFRHYQTQQHPIYYTDTDSFFYDYPVSETISTLEPYPTLPYQTLKTLPLSVAVKGESRREGTVIFRGKMYLQSSDSQAMSGWKPNPRHFTEIVENKLKFAEVERQVIRKWRTREHSVAVLKVGRWHIRKERYDIPTIKRLFQADNKRYRDNYDSYQLFFDGEKQPSRAWTLDETYKQMLRGDNRRLAESVELR